ncbi:hypothetical protein BDF20DRAFT_109855 [Mycotypha africana]|uniref:uncharacterized protein n=1 Tax=Mycotypha africana TaxID=64632 RepID=UPI002300BEF1|nr:uncharacterized protein BDF20DRAFT_109855 [Mycotypha africana]KAI8970179.1 hypothetical protein BDF20DRAFT_109855 [Mycotypha africana]
MAPLVLKIKGNKTFTPLSALNCEEDLSKAWRVCSKVRDSLENGSRLENLSWRLWFRQHLLNEKSNTRGSFRKLSITTARRLSSNCKLIPITSTVITQPPQHSKKRAYYNLHVKKEPYTAATDNSVVKMEPADNDINMVVHHDNGSADIQFMNSMPQLQQQRQQQQQQQHQHHQQQFLQQPQQPLQQLQQSLVIPTTLDDQTMFDANASAQNFALPQFTSDQTNGEIVQLDDIFNTFNGTNFANEVTSTDIPTTDMGMSMADGWDFGIPSPSNPYYSPPPMNQLMNNTTNNNSTTNNNIDNNTNSNNSSQNASVLGNLTYQTGATVHMIPQPAPSENDAMYVSGSTMPPPAASTLRNKLLESMQQHSQPNQLQQQLHPHQQTFSPSNPPSQPQSPYACSPFSPVPYDIPPPQHPHSPAPFHLQTLAISQQQQQQQQQQQPSALHLNSNNSSITNNNTNSHPYTTPGGTSTSTSSSVSPSVTNTANGATASTSNMSLTDNQSKPICTNCGATSTPLWRRSADDELLCNACGL